MTYFGTNIKKIRQIKGLSQQAFAELLNLNRGVISSYEEGRAEPKIESLLAIAQILNLTTDDLLTKPLTINKIANFSEVENLINEEETGEIEIQELLRNGSAKEFDLQKIFAKCEFVFEVDLQLASNSIYEKGTLLLLSKTKNSSKQSTGYIEIDNGNVTLLNEFKSSDTLYSIVGVLQTNANFSLLKSILNRIEKLESKVK